MHSIYNTNRLIGFNTTVLFSNVGMMDKNNIFAYLRLFGMLGGALMLLQAAFIFVIGFIFGSVSIGIIHISSTAPVFIVAVIVLIVGAVSFVLGIIVIKESKEIDASPTIRPFIMLMILGIISLFLDNGFVVGSVLVLLVAVIGVIIKAVSTASGGIAFSFNVGNRVCPNCGLISNGNANFCPSCGHNFTQKTGQ